MPCVVVIPGRIIVSDIFIFVTARVARRLEERSHCSCVARPNACGDVRTCPVERSGARCARQGRTLGVLASVPYVLHLPTAAHAEVATAPVIGTLIERCLGKSTIGGEQRNVP